MVKGMVSKRFYLTSILVPPILGGVLAFLLAMNAAEFRDDLGSFFFLLLMATIPPQIYSSIVFFVLWHKAWSAIQNQHARTTAGRAVGFALIPVFNIYWVFQLCWGFAKDYNNYLKRNNSWEVRLPEGLFLAGSILPLPTFILSRIPEVGFLFTIPALIVGGAIVNRLCDAINAIHRIRRIRGSQTSRQTEQLAIEARLAGITICLNCGTKVLPKTDGSCPSCLQPIVESSEESKNPAAQA